MIEIKTRVVDGEYEINFRTDVMWAFGTVQNVCRQIHDEVIGYPKASDFAIKRRKREDAGRNE